MQSGYICVAGIETVTGKHIRPVLRGRLTNSLLVRYGGPFDMGAVVQLGSVRYEGRPPEVEDYAFEPVHAHRLSVAAPADFWSLLQRTALPALAGTSAPASRRMALAVLSRGAKVSLRLAVLLPRPAHISTSAMRAKSA